MLNTKVALVSALLLFSISIVFPPIRREVVKIDVTDRGATAGETKSIGHVIILAPFWAWDKGDFSPSLIPLPPYLPNDNVIAISIDPGTSTNQSKFAAIYPLRYVSAEITLFNASVYQDKFAVGFWLVWEVIPILAIAAIMGWISRRRRVNIVKSLVVAVPLVILSMLASPKFGALSHGMLGLVWDGRSRFDILVVEWGLIVIAAIIIGFRDSSNDDTNIE
jgi:hypothetical protein